MLNNVIQISQSLNSILESIDKGHGILAELIKGSPDGKEPPLTLANLRTTFDNLNQLAVQMNLTLDKVNHGRGLANAMLSDKTDGKKLLDEVETTAVLMKDTAVKIESPNGSLQQW